MIKTTFLSYFRNWKVALYIISISMTVGILILLIQTKYMLDNIYSERIENDINNRIIYISSEGIIDLEKISNKNHIVEVKETNSKNSCIAVIDKYENVDMVIEEIKEFYSCNIYDTSGLQDIKVYNIISIIISAFLVIITFLVFTLIMLVVSGIIDGERKDIAILKAVGYTNKHILKIIFCRVTFTTIISYFIRNNS